MRSQVKLYEHPEFKMEEADLSLLSTICFVLSLALVGALFIAAFSCVLLWDDCISSFATYGSRPHLLTVQQVLRG
ncbi:hypothetical protein A0H81_04571 [Grifola frondosa]|uniref:Uncharacterized protein n=1 Tax=Grifola frondosa TaxID=5627 RepID=A0A1C7MFM8_GRIFR|nr:hypothetical protein A0H81_04571 [Grifola frondosa]